MGSISMIGSNRPGSATVRTTLENAIEKAGEVGFEKVVILLLDDRDEKYDVSYFNGGMSLSEIIALMRITERNMINDMMD